MFSDLLSPDVQSFIRENEFHDPASLILKYSDIRGVPMSVIVEQIMGRRKAKEKLPEFYRSSRIIYPHGLSMEQCSSEQSAKYKSNVVLAEIKEKTSCADLTGGFGVDSFFLSKSFKEVYYIEPDKNLFEIVRHNHQQLGAINIKHHNTTAQEFLASTKEVFACIFIDPSRRDVGNKKVFSFSDCVPDVKQLAENIFAKTDCLLIKASPLLDIQQGLKELVVGKSVFVVSVDNECKELLFFCKKNFANEPTVEAVNLSRDGVINSFAFLRSEEREIEGRFSELLDYLYEPNASVLKAGAFKIVGKRFNVLKLHSNTHLYTASKLVHDFPGRIFRVISNVKPDQKALKEFFPLGQANVITRNYPLSVQELRIKTRLKDGGDTYLLGFSGVKKKYLVAAERLA